MQSFAYDVQNCLQINENLKIKVFAEWECILGRFNRKIFKISHPQQALNHGFKKQK